MKLSDKINTKTIISSLNATCKKDVIHELLDRFINLKYLTSSVKLFSYLDNDKEIFNSASGRGISYHYHTSIEVDTVVVVLGISKQGIDYGASDGLLCHFILLILEPKDEPNRHRVFINLFQNLIKNSDIKSKILEVNSSLEIEKIIQKWEENDYSNELL